MEWDSETGLNHTQYRQYTSAQARWQTPDTTRGCVSFPRGQNLYAYVKGNPTNLIDLLGDDPISGEDPCGGTGWESNAGCQGPWGEGGGGDGGGNSGGGADGNSWVGGLHLPWTPCGTGCCDYYLNLVATGDKCDRSYGKWAYAYCVGFGNWSWANCVRGCLIQKDEICRQTFSSCILRDACRQGAHQQCYASCAVFGWFMWQEPAFSEFATN
jgi:RHS repeat-associated protein